MKRNYPTSLFTEIDTQEQINLSGGYQLKNLDDDIKDFFNVSSSGGKGGNGGDAVAISFGGDANANGGKGGR
jgi:hypothetical protein